MAKSKYSRDLVKVATRGFPRPLTAWTETVLLSLIGAWLWIGSVSIGQENLALTVKEHSQFFWPIIFVLLGALRYGFTRGFCCALFTALIALAWYRQNGILEAFSYPKTVGLMLTAMIAGEFRDAWEERIHRNDLDFAFMSRKMELFTQNYFMLRASHDQLEQRMAGQAVSLRSNISELERISLKNQLINVSQEQRLKDMAPAVMTLLSQIVGIETAGFYALNNQGKLLKQPLTALGAMPELNLEDPMVQDMLETGNLLSPVDLYSNDKNSEYQLCIPLKDSADEILACVIATQVKFFTLTEQNIAILNLVIRYAADMLSNGVIAPVIEPMQKRLFVRYLGPVLREKALRHEESAILFCKGNTEEALTLFDKTISTRRGADIYWRSKNTKGENVLVVLLPLTSLVQAQLFADRVKLQFERDALGAVEIVGPQSVNLEDDKFVQELKELGLENYLPDLKDALKASDVSQGVVKGSDPS